MKKKIWFPKAVFENIEKDQPDRVVLSTYIEFRLIYGLCDSDRDSIRIPSGQ